MTNEIQQTNPPTEHKTIPFGSRLKSAREALGLDRKDAAAQLRLTEKVILMMEKDKYPSDLPPTFIRGYIRAYGKLLQIPEYEIKKAIEPIQPKPVTADAVIPNAKAPLPLPITSSHYFIQFFTYIIVLTMVGLVGVWWYNNKASTHLAEAENLANSEINAATASNAETAASVQTEPQATGNVIPAVQPPAANPAAPNTGAPAANATTATTPTANAAQASQTNTAASTQAPVTNAEPQQNSAPVATAQPEQKTVNTAKPANHNEEQVESNSAADTEEEIDQNTEASNNNADNTETNSDNAD